MFFQKNRVYQYNDGPVYVVLSAPWTPINEVYNVSLRRVDVQYEVPFTYSYRKGSVQYWKEIRPKVTLLRKYRR